MAVSLWQDFLGAAAVGVAVFYEEHWVSGVPLPVGVTATPLVITFTNPYPTNTLIEIDHTTHFKEVDIAPGAHFKVALSVNRSGIEAPGVFTHTGAWATTNTGSTVMRYRPAPYMIRDKYVLSAGETFVYTLRPTVLDSTGTVTHVGLTFTAATVTVL